MSQSLVLPVEGGVPIHAWVEGVEFEHHARAQLQNVARLPFVFRHVAVMPDVHAGIGATVGTVLATLGAIVPAAVGVDIGCGMMAVQTTLNAKDLPDGLGKVRHTIEAAVPHGRSHNGGKHDAGAWNEVPDTVEAAWAELYPGYRAVLAKHPRASHPRPLDQLGTLGGGNHFVEVCLDEAGGVWVMLHSGSRGVGNSVGSYFIDMAREKIIRRQKELPDMNLAWLEEGSPLFEEYIEALGWAQEYARVNRVLMMNHTLRALRKHTKRFEVVEEAVNCHHNYVARETHFGQSVLVTRKGAVRAGLGELGIIPGSMGAKSFIVRGKGSEEAFCSCSHGAGRAMSRTDAKGRFTLADHRKATEGVECRKDKDVIDETPGAYKSIDAVMAAQTDLVEIVHTLKQVLCVKG